MKDTDCQLCNGEEITLPDPELKNVLCPSCCAKAVDFMLGMLAREIAKGEI